MLVDCVRAALNTTTGTQDITGDLSGNNPAAAILFFSGSTADATHADHARIGIGFTDGSAQYAASMAMRHGVSTTDTRRYQTSSSCIAAVDAETSTVGFAAGFDRWVADGIRINITNAPASAFFVHAVFLSGEDVSAHVNVASASAQDSATAITDVGFQSDVILFASIGTSSTAVTNTAKLSIGAATSSDQACISTFSDHANTSVVAGTRCADSRACAENDRNLDWSLEISDIDASGFDMTPRDGNCGAKIGYLALKFDNDTADVQVIDTPTATGNDAQVVGLQPQLVMLLMSSCDAVNTMELAADAGNIGVSMFDADSEFCLMAADEDAATTTNTSSMSDNTAVNFDTNTAANLMDASFVSMDATGFTLNYSVADATARKWIAISIEGAAVQTIEFLTGNVVIEQYAPVALKGPDAVILVEGSVSITGSQLTVPTVGTPQMLDSALTITGYAVVATSGSEFVAKPKTAILSIDSEPITISTGPWALVQDSLPVGWTQITDQCRS